MLKKTQVFGYISITMISIMIFNACGSKQILVEEPVYQDIRKPIRDIPLSTLAFEYNINKGALNNYINGYLDSLFTASIEADKGIEVKIARLSSSHIELQDKQVLIKLPLKLDAYKDSFLGQWSAYGEIDLTIISNVDISADWKMKTATEIADYQWIQKPTVGVGFLDIPLGPFTTEISERIKPIVENGIDEALQNNFDLKNQTELLLSPILEPYELDQAIGGWIDMTTDSIHFSPWQNGEDYITGRIYAPFKTAVRSQEPVSDSLKSLPPFTWNNKIGSISTFQIYAELGYDYLNNLAKSNLVNKSFSNGGRTVKVEDLNIYGKPNLISVDIETSGSFKGIISIEGLPVYNDGILSAKNVTWSLKTNNILHKTAAWIKKGHIHDELNKALVFDLNEYVTTAQEGLYDALTDFRTKNNIDLQLDWGPYDIDHLELDHYGIDALLKLDVEIKTIIDQVPQEF